MRCLPILMSSLLLACPALADWVILADGQRTRVLAFEITDRAVHMTTLTGKRWSVLRSAVDVEERTEVLVDVLYGEAFPFDAVELQRTQLRVLENRPRGYNFGASATVRITSIFGLDLEARYSKARATFLVEGAREIELDVGGLRLGAGLRLLFP